MFNFIKKLFKKRSKECVNQNDAVFARLRHIAEDVSVLKRDVARIDRAQYRKAKAEEPEKSPVPLEQLGLPAPSGNGKDWFS